MCDSRFLVSVCIVLSFILKDVNSMTLHLNEKLLAKKKVLGVGHSVIVHSLTQCLAVCNKEPKYCDGINYRDIDKKCRLLRKCANTTIVENSEGYEYYSKRPQVLLDGFVYEPRRSTCLRVIPELLYYAEADALCAALNGRLATLNHPAPNLLATDLLKKSQAQFAWIGLLDSGKEGEPTHSDGTSILKTEFFKPAPQHWRNSTNRNCWALNDEGYWAEFSCKNRKLYSICEVPPF